MALIGGSKALAGLDIGSSSIKIVLLKETGKEKISSGSIFYGIAGKHTNDICTDKEEIIIH